MYFVRIGMKSIFHFHFIKGTSVPPTSEGNTYLDVHREQDTESATLRSHKFQNIKSS